MQRYDVVVVGGGTAGPIAAIAAARVGARTLLVEKNGVLGGTITAGGVACVSSFHAYQEQVIAGIGWELVCRSRTLEGRPAPTEAEYWSSGASAMRVNPWVFAAVLDAACEEAGVEMLLHTMLAGVSATDDGWEVVLCTKNGLRSARAQVLIDATGDANAVALAGLELRRPDETQPATLVAALTGYNPETLDYDSIQRTFDAEVAAGRLAKSDTGWNGGDIRPLLRQRGGNCIHVVDVDGSDSESLTTAEVEGRRVLLRLMSFLRAQPGLEGIAIAWAAAQVGIRETVTIVGEETITGEDYTTGRRWDDAICYSFYPVDIHLRDGLDYRVIPEGIRPTIPFGALVPAGGRNLLAAGRIISGDRVANSAYRVQSTCMAVGHAAGCAAAVAARKGCDVGDAPLDEVRALLRSQGAIVPEADAT